jgi:hypothetical protein
VLWGWVGQLLAAVKSLARVIQLILPVRKVP